MARYLVLIVAVGLALSGCGRVKHRFLRTKVECCEKKAACCNEEICCLPRYAGGKTPKVQNTVKPVAIPVRIARERSGEEEQEKSGLFSRLNPLAYLRTGDKKGQDGAEDDEKKKDEKNFFGRIIPF
jgi:hypothetical protein